MMPPLQVAIENRINGSNFRKPWLAICYDSVCRKAWAKKSFNNDHSFDIEVAAQEVSQHLVSSACAVYDEAQALHCISFFICSVVTHLVARAGQIQQGPEERTPTYPC